MILKKKIKAVAVLLCLLTACGDATGLPVPNLQEGVITQQTAVDNTFPNVGEETTGTDKENKSETQTEEQILEKEVEKEELKSTEENKLEKQIEDIANNTQEELFQENQNTENVDKNEESTQIKETIEETIVYVTADILRIRNAPSTQAELVTHAVYGEPLRTIGETENGFLKVYLQDGTQAYASEQYVSEQKIEVLAETSYTFANMPIVNTANALYTYEEMALDIQQLTKQFPDRVSYQVVGTTEDNRNLYVVTLGNPEAKQYVVMHASIHAREYMTTLLVMKQLEYYATYYETGQINGIPFSDLFEQMKLVIVPMVNPDGVTISQLGIDGLQTQACKDRIMSFYEREANNRSLTTFLERFKANAKGVDLNRNFAYGWEEFVGSSVPASEKYKGETPASEIETQVLQSLTTPNQLAGISYHATGSILYWDFGQTGNLREQCLELTNLVHNVTNYTIQYASTDKQDEAGYCEWLVGIKQIPEVTIEIGTGTAPLSIFEFTSIWMKNKDVPASILALYMQK